MSQETTGGDAGALFYVARETPRLLETTDGWKLVGYNDRELGRAEGVRVAPFEVFIPEVGTVLGQRCCIDRLYWVQAQALLFIQGAALHQLIGPNYAVITAERCSPFDPRQHLKNVQLARVESAPLGLKLESLVVELRRRFT